MKLMLVSPLLSARESVEADLAGEEAATPVLKQPQRDELPLWEST